MRDESNAGRRAGDGFDDVDAAWDALEVGLTAYLSSMVDPEEVDHLLLELPGPSDGDGCPPYAQFAAFGNGAMVRAEVSGDAYLLPQHRLSEDGCEFLIDAGWRGNDDDEKNWYAERPLADVDEIAKHVVWVLRQHFGVAHPHLLTHQAWGPAAAGVALLGLCASEEVPEEGAYRPERSLRGHESVLDCIALKPDDRDELVRIVESLLREKYDAAPTVDDDGDFVLEHLGQPVWVRVWAEQPAVEIFARVAHDVPSRRRTALEVGLLNRDSPWVRWTMRERTVWQSVVIPGLPFAPAHLTVMLDLFRSVMAETRDDLVLRTGAKVA